MNNQGKDQDVPNPSNEVCIINDDSVGVTLDTVPYYKVCVVKDPNGIVGLQEGDFIILTFLKGDTDVNVYMNLRTFACFHASVALNNVRVRILEPGVDVGIRLG